MTLVATNTVNGANHFGGRVQASSILTAIESKLRTPYAGILIAYLLGASLTGVISATVAVASGLVVCLVMIAFEPQATTSANPLAARLAAAQAKNDALTAALNIAQARLNQSMAERDTLAVELTIDPLTGLQNRRGLDAAFAAYGADTVMALLDIDHFKKINDTLGHDAGDRVLREFATRLRAALNGNLPAYRIGGEEFVVLFPQAEMETVAALLADFRTDLQAANIVRNDDAISVSFSAGLAMRTDVGQNFDTIFKQADERLYAAKLTGRAKTVFSN
jgi:diguanylate cyclase (GGDEF)-like protein